MQYHVVGQRSTGVRLVHVKTAAVVAVVVMFLANLPQSRGQQIDTDNRSFEAASVKRDDTGTTQVRVAIAPSGRFTATNATVKMLIQQAFDLRDNQISGGPNWLDSEHYNIEANTGKSGAIRSGAAGEALLRMTLRSLLVERFGLAFHRESRAELMYQLVIARGGSKLKETKIPEFAPRVMRQEIGRLTGWATTMPRLASRLSQLLGRPVIDKTGLTGEYDFTLDYALDSVSRGDEPEIANRHLPSIFTALPERLGLRLQSTETAVDVIDGTLASLEDAAR